MSAPMIRAILSGAKTQTRRTVRHAHIAEADIFASAPGEHGWEFGWEFGVAGEGGVLAHGDYIRCPHGKPGDRLWVRETHAQFMVGEGMDRPVPQCVAYRATCDADGGFDYANGRGEVMRIKVTKWTPSIFMPRWASRITLEITEVRVQRLQEIEAADVVAEGLGPDDIRCDGECGATPCALAVPAFKRLWDSINGKRAPWSSNPWVWAIGFRRIEQP